MEKLKDPLFVSLIWCASTMHPLCDEVADKTFFSLGAVCKFSKKRAWWNRCPTLKIKIGKWCRWKIYHIICKKQNLSSFLENLPKGMKASSSLGLYYSISLRLNYPRRLSPALQLLPEVGSWHALNYHSSIDYMAIMGLPISTGLSDRCRNIYRINLFDQFFGNCFADLHTAQILLTIWYSDWLTNNTILRKKIWPFLPLMMLSESVIFKEEVQTCVWKCNIRH